MESFPEILKRLREEKKVPLRIVSESVGIDQAVLSKLENGQRRASREQVCKFASYYNVNDNELMIAWLSDKIVYELENEDLAVKALQVAEEKVSYILKNKVKTKKIIDLKEIKTVIRQVFDVQNKVRLAWLFGSYARGESNSLSDIDILIDVQESKKFNLFDIAEIKEKLQDRFGLPVDVVMLKAITPDIKKRIEKEMILIYETR
ncbi:MAG: nucleotidyltransferase domain-containing protein [Prolixibacteraceae bacterium]|nr:nucleotidyltransferase domain-containing protein [Prolixibacteraceae bacterium]